MNIGSGIVPLNSPGGSTVQWDAVRDLLYVLYCFLTHLFEHQPAISLIPEDIGKYFIPFFSANKMHKQFYRFECQKSIWLIWYFLAHYHYNERSASDTKQMTNAGQPLALDVDAAYWREWIWCGARRYWPVRRPVGVDVHSLMEAQRPTSSNWQKCSVRWSGSIAVCWTADPLTASRCSRATRRLD